MTHARWRAAQSLSPPYRLEYVDELIEVAINDDPTETAEDDVESFYHALHDANFNVIGLVDSAGDLVERYEYTPYGQRTVYFNPGTTPANDLACHAPTHISRRVEIGGTKQPYGLNDIGHQGLLHDEFLPVAGGTLVYNRARMLHPGYGRFIARDSEGYLDSANFYEYVAGNPVTRFDPRGEGLIEWIYTGQWNPPAEVYGAATSAAGNYYIQNAGATLAALDRVGAVDPTGVHSTVADSLRYLQGDALSTVIQNQPPAPITNAGQQITKDIHDWMPAVLVATVIADSLGKAMAAPCDEDDLPSTEDVEKSIRHRSLERVRCCWRMASTLKTFLRAAKASTAKHTLQRTGLWQSNMQITMATEFWKWRSPNQSTISEFGDMKGRILLIIGLPKFQFHGQNLTS